MWKTIGAAVAGYAAMVILVMPLFSGLAKAGVFGSDPVKSPEVPATGWLLLILAWNTVAGAAGGWVTSRIAGDGHARAMLSVVLLMLLMWVFSSFGETKEPMFMRFGNLATGLIGLCVGWQLHRRSRNGG